MGLLDIFFGKSNGKSAVQKPRTGFRNRSGEELAEYLTEGDVGLLNYAVDGNGAVTARVTEISNDAELFEELSVLGLYKLEDQLVIAGLLREDAARITGVVSRWAMEIKR